MMLTHGDALLILDHVVEVEFSVREIDDQDATEWDQTVDAEIYARVIICGKSFTVDCRIEIANNRCPFAEIYGDEDLALDREIVRVSRDLAGAISDDANSSNHRAMEYMPLLNVARDRAARLNEIPAHLTEKDLAA
ncbi:hypothetical protein [Sulfitobacter dubius]|uniref:hypothetical protein n=1 Tax=Sulfitobacter dubius TaxID=218673 RepID=UPI0022AFD683|nr:hypothetical protein [Sulfitobacter dubius]MCZ4366643.1 hypothetical protein [Sulfitobacter dubius]